MSQQLRALLPGYLQSLRKRRLTPATVHTYRQRLTGFFGWLGETGNEFTCEAFIAFLAHEQDRGLKGRTIRPAHAAIKDLALWLASEKLEAPCLKDVRAPRIQPAERYSPTDEEMGRFWHLAKQGSGITLAERVLRGKALVLLCLLSATAVRRHEFLNFRLTDLHARPGPKGPSRFLRVRRGKGGLTRDIPMSPEAALVLDEWQLVRDEWAACEPARSGNPWLLPVDSI